LKRSSVDWNSAYSIGYGVATFMYLDPGKYFTRGNSNRQCFFWKQKGGGTSAAGARGAPKARVEAPKAPRDGVWGGGVPLPTAQNG